MAAAFAQHHCNTRPAGQLYAAMPETMSLERRKVLKAFGANLLAVLRTDARHRHQNAQI